MSAGNMLRKCILALAMPLGLVGLTGSWASAADGKTQILGGQTVTVSQTDCLELVKHVPAADVVYEPGVDVHGRPVVPADIGGSLQVTPPKDFTIDITVRLDKRFGIPATADLYQPEANIGVVTIKGNKAYFNGQPLATESIDELAEICRKLTKQP